MTALILCVVSFISGLAIGLMLDEARRLWLGLDTVATITRSGSWRPWAITGVLLAMVLNGWTAVQLLHSQDQVQQLQDCRNVSTAAAIELWQGFSDLFADNPQAQPVQDLIDHYLDTLHQLQDAQTTGTPPDRTCEP